MNTTEAEVLDTPTALVRVEAQPVGVLRPADTLDNLAEAFAQYQKVCGRILDKSDYQDYQGVSRKKKSAWRKLATAFNVSTMKVDEQINRGERGVVSAKYTIRAYTGPKDNPHRQWEAEGYCDIHEKCCVAANGDKCHKAGWKTHTCCVSGCDGRKHWSHPDHDVIGTAQTRASNRAVADLIGCGEVSAEELTDDNGHGNERAPTQKAQPPKSRTEDEAEAAMGQALDHYAEGQQKATGTLEQLAEKPTKKGGKRYGVKLDGERWFNHFDGKIQENAVTLMGHRVRVVYVEGKFGKDLVSIEPDEYLPM